MLLLSLLATLATALAISFLCSLLEATLLSLSNTDIARMSETKPASAAIWRAFKEDIHRPIAVILIANTIANTMGASLAGAQFVRLCGAKWLVLFSIAFSAAVIIWSEILPKTLGVRHNVRLAMRFGLPLKYAVRLFTPVVRVIDWAARPFIGGRVSRPGPDALSDIGVLARFAQINNLITPEQENILSRSIRLSEALVRDIMVERNEIKFLSTKMTMIDALIEAHLHHHTRYILVEDGDLDRVLGYVNVKDIVSALQTNPSNPTLSGIARPVLEVRDTQRVTAILSRLTKGYQHIAVVKDETGRTAGLVTLEDVVEAIVGDIEDEYDVVPGYVHKLSDVRYIAGGGVSMAKLKEITGFPVPDADPHRDLDEWLCSRLQKTPAVENQVVSGEVMFIVRKVRRSRVHEAIVERRPQPDAGKSKSAA